MESSPDVGLRFVDICCTFTQSTLSLSTLCCTWSGMFAPTCRLLIARSRYVSFRRSMWPCRDLSASCIVYIQWNKTVISAEYTILKDCGLNMRSEVGNQPNMVVRLVFKKFWLEVHVPSSQCHWLVHFPSNIKSFNEHL